VNEPEIGGDEFARLRPGQRERKRQSRTCVQQAASIGELLHGFDPGEEVGQGAPEAGPASLGIERLKRWAVAVKI
jgi:hypothetical protein